MIEGENDNTQVVTESPANDPNAPAPEQVEQDNANARAAQGANAGIDNASAARKGKKTKTTAYTNEDGSPVDPVSGDATNTGQPAKMDSFGRPGDSPQPRPTVTPDLAEPLHDGAAAGPGAAVGDTGETTARLHSGMRAAGARQYGIGQDPQDEPEAQSAEVGEVTDPSHAMNLIKGKTSEFHQLVHNIGNVAEVPLHAIESLLAEIQYLLGIVRRA